MILVDSSVWIDHFRGNATAPARHLARLLLHGADIAITDVMYMELLRGVRRDEDVRGLRDLLGHLTILQTESLGDYEVAAELFRRVRRGGDTVRQSSDCLIAAVAIREGVALLHDDRDFDLICATSELTCLSPPTS